MLNGAQCFVIVPARNEEALIGRVIETMPAFVDHIFIVDDASTDRTISRVNDYMQNTRISIVVHERSRGVGAAISSGYRAALARGGAPNDAFCVMAGDGQMSPDDLERVAAPVLRGDADYVKGNRFTDAHVKTTMPALRYWGGRVFSRATAIALARDIHDSQCGFTAIAREACARLDLDHLWPSYGYPNDLLSQAVLRNFRIDEVAVKPLYGQESSGLRPYHGAIISALILRAWVRRMVSR